ncbi:DUF6992 family protein [Solirubrum puertoriconensis]|uniref:Uncharacterized protein n=1 Tax=Solirubrum puertoriconensis TaxID=1751427 RepID=A0A9X0L513_SOLP1|nr:hypothetical protein [Solirubrum puertoriconensis]KUG08070.1 hypothetical protein ASU33_07670 [Solirubrum puertoriconensis]
MPVLSDVAAALPAINFQREMLAQQGMGVLGAWALLNLLGSGWLVTRTLPKQAQHYFHQMNVGWGVVNAFLAAWGILQARPLHVEGLTLVDSLQAQFAFEKILLFNAGLDVAYVAVGAWLFARAASVEELPERYLGYARSLWVQGGFLFVFDVGFYLVYHRCAAELLALVP